MGSKNSTDSVSFASDIVYRLKSGLRRIARSITVSAERIARRPLSKATKKKIAMSATRRETFVWTVTRNGSEPADRLFVRVEQDEPKPQAEIFPEEPVVRSVRQMPSAAVPTSSGAAIYEFSSNRLDLDIADCEEPEPYIPSEHAPAARAVEDEPEEFYEGLYEDLAVESVLDCIDSADIEVSAQSQMTAGSCTDMIVASPVQIVAYSADTQVPEVIEAYEPAEIADELDEEFYRNLYDTLTSDAILDFIESMESQIPAEETPEEREFFEGLYEDLAVESVMDYIATIRTEAYRPEYVISEILCPVECITEIPFETERAYVPDYVISEIECPEECVTEVYSYDSAASEPEMNAAEVVSIPLLPAPQTVPAEEAAEAQESVQEPEVIYAPEVFRTEEASETVQEPETVQAAEPEPVQTAEAVCAPVAAQKNDDSARKMPDTVAGFIFGFQSPVSSAKGTGFRFVIGTEEEPDDDSESICIVAHDVSDSAVAASSVESAGMLF